MKRKLGLLFLALVLAAASAALATVTDDPLRMLIVDPPGGLAPGQTHVMTLRIEAFATVFIDEPLVTGRGWTVRSLDRAGPLDLRSGDVIELRYEVTPTDPDRPLTIEYIVDGRMVATAFDPVETHWRPGQMTRTGDSPFGSDTPRIDKFTRPSTPTPPLSAQDPRFADLEDDPAKRARTMTVFGNILMGSNEVDGATVRAMDRNDVINIELASATTDIHGNFNLSFVWYEPYWDFDPDIYLVVEASNHAVSVHEEGMVPFYSWTSETQYNVTGDFINLGEYQVGDHYGAFGVLIGVTRAARFLDFHSGITLPHIRANWPFDGAVSRFDRPSEQVFFNGSATWLPEVHAHEYAHFFAWRTAGLPMNPPNPAGMYCNVGDYCDGAHNVDCGHCIWCPEYDEVAWSEGFSNWVGDAVTRDWTETYGVSPWSSYGVHGETSHFCDGIRQDAHLTEGFFTLLLHDIDDDTADDDQVAPHLVDQLSLGYNEILTVIVNDMGGDLSPQTFIDAFMSRYPQHRVPFWETAANTGYFGLDTVNPQTRTIYSTHAEGVASTDDTIDMSWLAGTDDMSGIAGYSYVLASGSPQAPDTGGPSGPTSAGQTSLSFASMAPGNYYFTLRAFDREGNYDATYETYGPIIIQSPDPADMGPYTRFGWSGPVLPRSTNDVTSTYAPAPSTILSQDTYWNLGIINNGSASTSSVFNTALLVDGEVMGSFFLATVTGGTHYQRMNQGTIPIRGGRHTFTAYTDYTGTLAEPDELDNHYGEQWIWNPTVFYATPEMTRPSPPLRTGGWDGATTASWYNCDGLRIITSPSEDLIAAVYMAPDHANDNYDMRLHEYATDANTGFSFNLGYSTRPAGYLDAVLVNADNDPAILYDVGVLNAQDEIDGDYRARVLYAQDLPLNTTVADTLPSGQLMMLYKFHVSSAEAGPKTILIDMDPNVFFSDLYAAWYDETFTTGALLHYDAVAEEDYDGDIVLHIDAAEGLHTLALWDEPGFGAEGMRPMTIRIRNRWPDMVAHTPAGWDSCLVPRPAADATDTWAPLPTSLPGDAASTYLNYSYVNISPGEGGSFGTTIQRDGSTITGVMQSSTGTGTPFLVRRSTPSTVTGGRHTLTMLIDPDYYLNEDIRDNNTYGAQFVWQPSQLAMDVGQVRDNPRSPTGGWADVSGATELYYNADGMRSPLFAPGNDQGFWGAVAVVPAAGTDLDLRLHAPSTGATDGFAEALCSSVWPPDETEFVLVNFNETTDYLYDAGVTRVAGSSSYDYRIVATESSYLGTRPGGHHGPFTMGAGDIVRLHEGNFSAGDTITITLESLSNDCDLGFSLYGPTAAYYGKGEACADPLAGPAMAYAAPAGEDETIDFIPATTGYYCLAVWKRQAADDGQAVDYRLKVFVEGVSAVRDELPRVTRLVGAHPNPFNPSTRVAFEVAEQQRVVLQIFDLRGRRVRTLENGTVGPGRHQRIWDGRDDRGAQMASGVWFVRFVGRDVTQTRKIMLIK